MKIELVDKKRESGDAVTFIFKSKTPIEWKAGQFLFYTLPHQNPDERGVTRYFTNSASPFEKNIHITTRISSKCSSFKNRLSRMKIGSTIEATDPDGDFTIDDPRKNFVFLSGGIGITPYRSILLDLDHKSIPVSAVLLYANSDNNFLFKEELETLAIKHPSFRIRYFVSPKHIEKEDIQRAIDEIGDEPMIYVSGPEPMTEAFEKLLKEDIRLPENRIRLDFFPGYGIIRQ
ncbi:MAG: FAD-dependent oxidoreductase [Candidatus Levyibacteriota bacterium]